MSHTLSHLLEKVGAEVGRAPLPGNRRQIESPERRPLQIPQLFPFLEAKPQLVPICFAALSPNLLPVPGAHGRKIIIKALPALPSRPMILMGAPPQPIRAFKNSSFFRRKKKKVNRHGANLLSQRLRPVGKRKPYIIRWLTRSHQQP